MSAVRRTVFDLAEITREVLRLENEVQKPDFWENHQKAAEVSARLNELKEKRDFWKKLVTDSESLKELAEKASSPEEQKTIEAEFSHIEKILETEKKAMLFSGKYDKGDAVISIYSGAGGDDAEEWASILLEIYRRYAEKKGWNTMLLHHHKNETGGTKNVTFEVSGKFAYGYLKGESGVHRLVRISPYSAKKLRHTSFALAEVMPKQVSAEDVKINTEDIEVDFTRSSGPGGQNVNKRETAVQMTHKPTGLKVKVETSRSQSHNREIAMELLRSKIYKAAVLKSKEELRELRGGKLPQAEWGHQIRSYVLHPYKMVKDHRTGVETSDVDAVLAGDLDEFIEAEIGLEN